MATLHGAPLPKDFEDGNPLTAAEFNAVKNYWVTDELPDTAENGDVVFVADGGVVSASGGGKILQVVSDSRKTPVETNVLYSDALSLGYPCTITIQENSRLLAIAYAGFYGGNTSGPWCNNGKTFLFLNGNVVAESEHDGHNSPHGGSNTIVDLAVTQSINFMSDPLPAGTYTVDVRGCITYGSQPITFNRAGTSGRLIVMEVGA